MKIPPHIRVYGDINWRGTCPTETAEQATFFNRLRKQYPKTYGAIGLHIKNEGKRSFQQMAKQRAEGGFIKGACDIVIPARQSFVCELKRKDHTKSKWQSGQIDYMTTCRDLGAFVCVAFGWEAAWEAFEEWEKLKVLDLFSGIGGFSLGLDRTGGFDTVAFCEIEEFPRRVLAKHWPEVPCYEDVTKLTGGILKRDGISVDVITGGFPCQDISVAGNQAGIGEGTRSGLWSECIRLVSEIRPQYAIFENVSALLSGPTEKRGGWFSRILGDLAEIGYDVEWHSITSASVGAEHKRDRVWILAYPNKTQLKRGAYPSEYNRNTPSLATHAGGKINPEWTEWLMGFPHKWTDLDA